MFLHSTTQNKSGMIFALRPCNSLCHTKTRNAENVIRKAKGALDGAKDL